MSIVMTLLMIAVSLSMDTFSISLGISTFNISKRKILLLCLLVGIFHFVFPIISSFLGYKIIRYLNINANMLLGLILLFIAIQMIFNLKNNKTYSFSMLSIILIAISVSLDSFSTGFGLKAITSNILIASLIFSISSVLFTLLGYFIGKYSSKKLGLYANIIGIIILLFIGFLHLMK